MSAKGKTVQKEEVQEDESATDTEFSLSAYILLFGIIGGFVAACEVFFDFIPAWEFLVSLIALYMSQVFREWVLRICLDLDMEVGTAVFLRRVAEMSLLISLLFCRFRALPALPPQLNQDLKKHSDAQLNGIDNAARKSAEEGGKPDSGVAVGQAVAAIPILNSVGVHTTSLTAVLTSCTFALGLASQKALQNMAAGIMIMIFQPYKIGDRVELENVSGFVFDIQLSETLINTLDNERVSLPNSDIYG